MNVLEIIEIKKKENFKKIKLNNENCIKIMSFKVFTLNFVDENSMK